MGIGCVPQTGAGTIVTAFPVKRGECSMNAIIRTAAAVAALLALAGCSGMEYEAAEMSPASGDTYQRDLHDDYVRLSKSEFDQGDYVDSDRYAERALTLSDGKHVQPEMISARDLPPDKVDELTEARLRLMTVMSAGAAEKKPLEAAMAQSNFDCWMEQQEENFQPDDIAACRDGFMMAMAELEEQPEVVEVPAAEPMMATPEAYIVHFNFDEAALTPDARTVLADVVKSAKHSNYETIDISGYTDLVGTDAYNQVLSEQRANAVIDFLVDSGVEAGKIVGRGLGKADPVVAAQAPEMQNRRVEINLEP
jgi:OmpA-OmpF porin, OOP family